MENEEQMKENLNNFKCISFPLTRYFFKRRLAISKHFFTFN